jgi:hypothetical protein
MRVSSFKGIIILLFLLCFANSCYPIRYDGPYKGRVVDAETGKPIEGVVVLGVWYKEIATAAGGVGSYYDAEETVTDKNGEFEIKGMGLKVLTNIGPMNFFIFKAGHEYIGMYPWETLKTDPRKIMWKGDQAIIPLRELTLEERKSRLFGKENVPEEKQRLLIRELNRERLSIGLTPYEDVK